MFRFVLLETNTLLALCPIFNLQLPSFLGPVRRIGCSRYGQELAGKAGALEHEL